MGVGAMKEGVQMGLNDVSQMENGVTLEFRRYSCWSLGDGCPADWSIRLKLLPTGSTISGSRQWPSNDGRRSGPIERHKFRVSRAWVKALKLRLAALRIPAIPNFVVGCDGEYKELVYDGIGGRTAYRWWSCPPDGWDGMDNLFRDVYALFDAMASIKSAAPSVCSPYARLCCTVAGTSHVLGIMELTQGLDVGSQLRLERDEGNTYDPNAVAVLTEDGDQIGFVPKERNRRLAELMSGNVVFSAVVSEIRDKNKYREITIHVIEHRKELAESGVHCRIVSWGEEIKPERVIEITDLGDVKGVSYRPYSDNYPYFDMTIELSGLILHSKHKLSYAAALGGVVVDGRDLCLRGERLRLMISDPRVLLCGYLSLVEDEQLRRKLVFDSLSRSKAVAVLKAYKLYHRGLQRQVVPDEQAYEKFSKMMADIGQHGDNFFCAVLNGRAGFNESDSQSAGPH